MVDKSKWLEDEEEWVLPTLRKQSVDCCSSGHGHGFTSSLFPGIHTTTTTALHNNNNSNNNSNNYNSNNNSNSNINCNGNSYRINIDTNNHSGNYSNNSNSINHSNSSGHSLTLLTLPATTSSHISSDGYSRIHGEKEKEREKDREKERGKDKEKEKDRGRDRERERENERDRETDREKDREREKEKEKENNFITISRRKATSPRASNLTPPHSNQNSRHSLLLALPNGHSSSFILPNLSSVCTRYVQAYNLK